MPQRLPIRNSKHTQGLETERIITQKHLDSCHTMKVLCFVVSAFHLTYGNVVAQIDEVSKLQKKVLI
jgi:hypothetical protein